MCRSVWSRHRQPMSGGVIQGHALARVPSRLDMAVFAAKASAFRLKRVAGEAIARHRVKRLDKGRSLGDAPVAARVSSPLWSGLSGVKEHALTAGKIHNLRLALSEIDGVEVEPGEIFSFWKQVGR